MREVSLGQIIPTKEEIDSLTKLLDESAKKPMTMQEWLLPRQSDRIPIQAIQTALTEMYLAHKINDSVSVTEAYNKAMEILRRLKEPETHKS